MDDATENPFQAPKHANDEATLDSDTEFLVSESSILCGETVTLPRVCIHSGSTDNLARKLETLIYTPPWILRLRVIFIALSLGPLLEIARAFIGGGGNFVRTQVVFYAIIISLAVASVVLGEVMKRKLNCIWWVDVKARRKIFWFLPRSPPVYAGTHRGLNVLVGLSPEFLQRVQQMIEESALQDRRGD